MGLPSEAVPSEVSLEHSVASSLNIQLLISLPAEAWVLYGHRMVGGGEVGRVGQKVTFEQKNRDNCS